MYLLSTSGAVKSEQINKSFNEENVENESNAIPSSVLNPGENNLVKQIEPIIWYSDVTHDGLNEKIVVDLTYVLNYPRTGEEQTVSIYAGKTGDLIWTGHADTVHPGWNGFYIYDDGNNEYLLTWRPTIYQNSADFILNIFSLTDDGEEHELYTENVPFNMLDDDLDADVIISFVNKVNGYLDNCYVLVDTDNSTPVYSTKDNKMKQYYDISKVLAFEQ
jgi:hypothetical protein